MRTILRRVRRRVHPAMWLPSLQRRLRAREYGVYTTLLKIIYDPVLRNERIFFVIFFSLSIHVLAVRAA